LRPLSEIVTRRATSLIESAQASAEREGRKLSERQIAARMAEHMGTNPDSVQKQLRRFLAGESTWRVDYVEALAQSLGAHVSDLLAAETDVPEATRGALLVAAVGSRLSAKEARELARLLSMLRDDRPRWALAMKTLGTLTEATTPGDLIAGISKSALASRAWETRARSLRGRRAKSDK